MTLACRTDDGFVYVIDDDFAASFVAGQWERGFVHPPASTALESHTVSDDEAAILALEARAALGIIAPATGVGSDSRWC
jgi:hypothetical protein